MGGWQKTEGGEGGTDTGCPGKRTGDLVHRGERSFVSDGSCVKGRVPGPAQNRRRERRGGEGRAEGPSTVCDPCSIKVLSYDQLFPDEVFPSSSV